MYNTYSNQQCCSTATSGCESNSKDLYSALDYLQEDKLGMVCIAIKDSYDIQKQFDI